MHPDILLVLVELNHDSVKLSKIKKNSASFIAFSKADTKCLPQCNMSKYRRSWISENYLSERTKTQYHHPDMKLQSTLQCNLLGDADEIQYLAERGCWKHTQ